MGEASAGATEKLRPPETGVTVLRRLSVLLQRLRPRPIDSPGPGTPEHVGPSPGASPSSPVSVLGLPQASAGSCGNPGSCAGARLSASVPLRGTETRSMRLGTLLKRHCA